MKNLKTGFLLAATLVVFNNFCNAQPGCNLVYEISTTEVSSLGCADGYVYVTVETWQAYIEVFSDGEFIIGFMAYPSSPFGVGLTAGSYDLVIHYTFYDEEGNAINCEILDSVTINEPPCVPISITYVAPNLANCYSGSITIEVPAGYFGFYTYHLFGDNGFYAIFDVYSGETHSYSVSSGTYDLDYYNPCLECAGFQSIVVPDVPCPVVTELEVQNATNHGCQGVVSLYGNLEGEDFYYYAVYDSNYQLIANEASNTNTWTYVPLPTGHYYATVYFDCEICSQFWEFDILEPECSNSATAGGTNPTNAFNNNGYISVWGFDGYSTAYSYAVYDLNDAQLWSGVQNNGEWASQYFLPGDYNVVVSNHCASPDCSYYFNITIDEFQPADCEGDFNNDGVRSTPDLLLFLSAMGCTLNCGGPDLSSDGAVNTSDLLLLLSLFGTPCP